MIEWKAAAAARSEQKKLQRCTLPFQISRFCMEAMLLQRVVQSQLNIPLNVMFDDSDQVLSVNYLPPIWISCDVRSELYPDRNPPVVNISDSWLQTSQRQKLEASLLRYWNDTRDQVLFAC